MTTHGPSHAKHAKPVSWPASEYWDGADGNWSSFSLRVGSNEEILRVLPATAGQALWAVSSHGCLRGEPGTSSSVSCSDSRGGLFNTSESTSWNSLGNYSMGLESNLGYNHNSSYGLDTVALGLSNTTGGPYLGSQLVADFQTNDYYIGLFGLGQQPTNFSTFDTPHPSFLTSLKSEGIIPSLSWGYTAGARYQSTGVFGSLTLGGYDSSRLVPNNVSFSLAADISRDLLVSLQAITATYANGSVTPFLPTPLPTPIWTFIDSTIPDIYLPTDVCKTFENVFGLQWNATYQMYFVDDNVHGNLMAANPNITFQIANSTTGEATVDIILPYASFDLMLEYPLTPGSLPNSLPGNLPPSLRYFPLRRAANETQYTLGRTFLQEAYVITNYEQLNFSVFQSKFKDIVKQHIVTIPSASAVPESHVSQSTKIGLGLGIIAFVLLIVLAVVLVLGKRRNARRRERSRHSTKPIGSSKHLGSPDILTVQEIAMNSLVDIYRELPDSGKTELLDASAPTGSGHEISELSQPSLPIAHELMNHHSSDELSIAQNPKRKDKFAILVSTNMSRESWAITGPSTGLASIETTISSQKTKEVDLDRSLPPTPISESLQASPVVASFQKCSVTRKGAKIVLGEASAASPILGIIGQVSSNTPFDVAENDSILREIPHWSCSSMELEIVIPPGHSEADIIKPLKIYKNDGRRHCRFF